METVGSAAETGSRALPHRLARIGVWVGGVALLLAVLDLLGVPVLAWVRDLFEKVAEVPAWAIAAGVLLESADQPRARLLGAAGEDPRAAAQRRRDPALAAFDRPAADRLRLGRDLRGRPRLLGLRLVRRQAAGRVLLRRGEGEEPRGQGQPQGPATCLTRTKQDLGQLASSHARITGSTRRGAQR